LNQMMVFAGAIATIALELMVVDAAYREALARFQMAVHPVLLLMGLYKGALLFDTVPVLWSLRGAAWYG